MTLGTVVVEAAEGSGARWTVYQALEQNREVFCVPGSIFSPASRFTNRMIQEGAKLVATCGDILEELNLSSLNVPGPTAPPAELDEQAPLELVFPGTPECGDPECGDEERVLLGHIGGQPVHIDEICRQSGLPITAINSMLTMLELQGTVRQVGCMHYVRSLPAGVGHDN
jgi:DNA processing protein